MNVKWKVEQVGNDVVITFVHNGQETVKRETGERAAAMIAAYVSVDKLGVWCGPAA